MTIEIAFHPALYKTLNSDLASLCEDEQLLNHYLEHGYSEGRICCEVTSRDQLISTISPTANVLEIGAFATPITLDLPNVDHFDVLDKGQLIRRAEEFGFPTHLIQDIRYVDPNGDLEIVPKGFYNAVVSCHVLEHQPCLVRHINQVMGLLQAGGSYLLVIPDKRFIFDQPLPPTRLSEVIDAYINQRTRHTLTAVIDDVYSSGHNDWKRHWAGDHAIDAKDVSLVAEAITRFNTGEYIDVHSWRFTPMSFEQIFNDLTKLNLFTDQISARIYPTIYGSHEFYVHLSRG